MDQAARNSLMRNQFRLSNIPFQHNDSEQRNRSEGVYNHANWIRSKSSITLGVVEILISIALFSGFVGPLKLSAVYIIWLFTLFGIVSDFPEYYPFCMVFHMARLVDFLKPCGSSFP